MKEVTAQGHVVMLVGGMPGKALVISLTSPDVQQEEFASLVGQASDIVLTACFKRLVTDVRNGLLDKK